MPWHRLKVGSPVMISLYPEEKGDPDSQQGVVSARENNSIEIALNDWLEGRCFRIDLTADEITRQRQLAAITAAKDAKGRLRQLRDVLMGEQAPAFHEFKEIILDMALTIKGRQLEEGAKPKIRAMLKNSAISAITPNRP